SDVQAPQSFDLDAEMIQRVGKLQSASAYVRQALGDFDTAVFGQAMSWLIALLAFYQHTPCENHRPGFLSCGSQLAVDEQLVKPDLTHVLRVTMRSASSFKRCARAPRG